MTERLRELLFELYLQMSHLDIVYTVWIWI